jgi:hypothetical protein
MEEPLEAVTKRHERMDFGDFNVNADIWESRLAKHWQMGRSRVHFELQGNDLTWSCGSWRYLAQIVSLYAEVGHKFRVPRPLARGYAGPWLIIEELTMLMHPEIAFGVTGFKAILEGSADLRQLCDRTIRDQEYMLKCYDVVMKAALLTSVSRCPVDRIHFGREAVMCSWGEWDPWVDPQLPNGFLNAWLNKQAGSFITRYRLSDTGHVVIDFADPISYYDCFDHGDYADDTIHDDSISNDYDYDDDDNEDDSIGNEDDAMDDEAPVNEVQEEFAEPSRPSEELAGRQPQVTSPVPSPVPSPVQSPIPELPQVPTTTTTTTYVVDKLLSVESSRFLLPQEEDQEEDSAAVTWCLNRVSTTTRGGCDDDDNHERNTGSESRSSSNSNSIMRITVHSTDAAALCEVWDTCMLKPEVRAASYEARMTVTPRAQQVLRQAIQGLDLGPNHDNDDDDDDDDTDTSDNIVTWWVAEENGIMRVSSRAMATELEAVFQRPDDLTCIRTNCILPDDDEKHPAANRLPGRAPGQVHAAFKCVAARDLCKGAVVGLYNRFCTVRCISEVDQQVKALLDTTMEFNLPDGLGLSIDAVPVCNPAANINDRTGPTELNDGRDYRIPGATKSDNVAYYNYLRIERLLPKPSTSTSPSDEVELRIMPCTMLQVPRNRVIKAGQEAYSTYGTGYWANWMQNLPVREAALRDPGHSEPRKCRAHYA